jgi:hypothetical protein
MKEEPEERWSILWAILFALLSWGAFAWIVLA